jgi:predicted nucleic acid-binding protein
MLLLDSEALSLLANGPPKRRERVRALITEMRDRALPVATVSAVLAEVIRGHHRDAGVFAALRYERIAIRAVDTRVGLRAGQLLGSANADSRHAVDAFVVAVGDLAGGAVVATVDPDGMRSLAAHATGVKVENIA